MIVREYRGQLAAVQYRRLDTTLPANYIPDWISLGHDKVPPASGEIATVRPPRTGSTLKAGRPLLSRSLSLSLSPTRSLPCLFLFFRLATIVRSVQITH